MSVEGPCIDSTTNVSVRAEMNIPSEQRQQKHSNTKVSKELHRPFSFIRFVSMIGCIYCSSSVPFYMKVPLTNIIHCFT